jgi:hypothetical protein
MSKIERVKFVDATKQYGPPNEPTRLYVEFKLIPGPDLQWSELFERKLKQYNRTKNDPDWETGLEEAEDLSVWKFSQTGNDEELVKVYCHSVGEITPLHEALKGIVRLTNEEYPKFVERLEADHAKETTENNEIQRLKRTLKSEI